jgi:hypothetical protein
LNWHKLPGYAASALMIVFTAVWSFWGIGEMYHEGWWGAWYNCLPYLVPVAASLIPTMVAMTWPIAGGVIILLVAAVFIAIFGLDNPLMGGFMGVLGAMFLYDGWYRRRTGWEPDQGMPWWRRNFGYLMAVGLPLVILVGFSINRLPVVLTRVDDGDRGARLIEGNGINLVWAPKGPGWNYKQPWGGYPSWHDVALYGMEPVGLDDKPGYGWEIGVFASAEDMAATNLCRYLSPDGTTLMGQPQGIWRMPTTNEMVRSLVRDGENAGCTWNGEDQVQVECDITPDKESPLWATDEPVIYYWTADSYDDREGYYVSYNGWVQTATKTGGNPRHSYRCVKEP